jgi:hypothetical protein
MSLAHSPRIVTDGLVLCLDAGNTKSYPGSGTTWTDLSGNGNDGTLENGVGYSGDNLGSLSFDGSNDYVDCGSVANLGNTFTVKVITKTESFPLSYNPLIFRDGNTANNFGLRFDSSGYIEVRQYAGTELRQGPYSTSTWYDICVSISNLEADLYVNGEYKASHTFPNNFNHSGNIRLGIYSYSSGYYYNGNIAQVSIYNRALTSSEIQQNYNPIYNLNTKTKRN